MGMSPSCTFICHKMNFLVRGNSVLVWNFFMDIGNTFFKSMNGGIRSVIRGKDKVVSISISLSAHRLSPSRPSLVLLFLGCVNL